MNAPRIVVGLHNTAAARRALRWAFAMATRRSAALEVVTAFRSVVLVPMGCEGVFVDRCTRFGAMRELQAQMLQSELGAAAGGSMIAAEVLDCEPGEALNNASIDAELLVLGLRSRRIGRLARASTLRICSKGAHCALVVVRDDLEIPSHVPGTPGLIAVRDLSSPAHRPAHDRITPTPSHRMPRRGFTRRNAQ